MKNRSESSIATHSVKVVLALIIASAGFGKLFGVQELHHSFEVLGLPEWFGFFVGASEVAGAIGLFIAPLFLFANAGIAIILLGAVYYHLTYTPVIESLTALVALLMCVFLFVRRPRF